MSHEVESLTVIERGNAIVITNATEYTAAAEYLKGVTALQRRIQEHYAPMKKAAHDLHKQLTAAEQTQLSPLELVVSRVKGMLIGWENMEKKRAFEEQKRLQELAEKNTPKGSHVPQVPAAQTVPTVGGLSSRSTWKCIVDDESLVPREYLIPDQKALDAAAKRMKENFNVPGCRAIEDQNKIVRGV